MPKTRRETKCDNESVEATTKNQKPGLYKIQQWFLLIFRPQTKVTKPNCFWEDLWGCIWTKFLVPIYIAGGFPWFGFCGSAGCRWCRQKWVGCLDFVGLKVSCSIFKCYVFRFVEAVFVFSRNVFTKSEDPTPPAFMLHRYLHTYIYTYTGYITLRCITLHYTTARLHYITVQY